MPVAASTFKTCSAGKGLERLIQVHTEGCVTPTRRANADCDPAILIACCNASVGVVTASIASSIDTSIAESIDAFA